MCRAAIECRGGARATRKGESDTRRAKYYVSFRAGPQKNQENSKKQERDEAELQEARSKLEVLEKSRGILIRLFAI